MSACIGWVGHVFGHRFRARYSEVHERPSDYHSFEMGEGATVEQVEQVLLALRGGSRTYRGDVCERCGMLVNQEDAA